MGFGEISLFAKSLEKDANPGNVMLKGEDGSILLATPYWPQNKKEKNALSWLVTGVKENIRYTATYFELYSNEKFIEEIVFIPGKNGKLQAVSWEAPEMP